MLSIPLPPPPPHLCLSFILIPSFQCTTVACATLLSIWIVAKKDRGMKMLKFDSQTFESRQPWYLRLNIPSPPSRSSSRWYYETRMRSLKMPPICMCINHTVYTSGLSYLHGTPFSEKHRFRIVPFSFYENLPIYKFSNYPLMLNM